MGKSYSKSEKKSTEKNQLSADEIKKSLDFMAYYSRDLGRDLPKVKADGWTENFPCPFHDDQTGSFGVNIHDGAFTCFGCGAKGDVFQFHMKRHGCDFKQALKDLASFAGISQTAPPPAPGKKEDPGRKKRIFGNLVGTYFYHDADGNDHMMVKKYVDPQNPADKIFIQHRPTGAGGWIKGVKGHVKPLPYRLPEVVGADLVVIVEGEKDADALADIGLTATTNPGGAGKWPDYFQDYFQDKNVVILPDNDEPGRDHAGQVAGNLHATAKSIKILDLPGLPPKGDVSDWLAMPGNDADALRTLADACDPWTPPKETDATRKTGKKKKKERGPTVADTLMTLIPAENLFHDSEGNGFADIYREDHRETWPLESKGFKDFLAYNGFKAFGKIPSSSAIKDALAGLDGRARFEGPERHVFVRLGGLRDRIYLDLCRDDWTVIEISPDGWRKIQDPENIRFWRPKGLLPLPEPSTDGSVEHLCDLIQLDDAALKKITAWLLSTLNTQSPFPILAVGGEQGSGKSTASKIIRRTVDPNVADLRSMPQNERDLMLAAKNSRVIALDNLSGMRTEMADALCRLSTGGGYAARGLYTDSDECIYNETRPIMLNGIPDLLARGDLGDRAICLDLERISTEDRQTEKSLYRRFEELHPLILGGLLDAVVSGLKHRDTIDLGALPRMADACEWWAACESGGALPWPVGGCLTAFEQSRESIVTGFLEGDTVAAGIVELMKTHCDFEGTATDLLNALNLQRGEQKPPRGWPGTPRAMTARLKRAAPFLRECGLEIEKDRTGTARTLFIYSSIEKKEPSQPSPEPSQPEIF